MESCIVIKPNDCPQQLIPPTPPPPPISKRPSRAVMAPPPPPVKKRPSRGATALPAAPPIQVHYHDRTVLFMIRPGQNDPALQESSDKRAKTSIPTDLK